MSTYYALACQRCKIMVNFTRRGGAGMGWMVAGGLDVPPFVERHAEHLDELRVISEHDDRWTEWDDFSEALAAPQGKTP